MEVPLLLVTNHRVICVDLGLRFCNVEWIVDLVDVIQVERNQYAVKLIQFYSADTELEILQSNVLRRQNSVPSRFKAPVLKSRSYGLEFLTRTMMLENESEAEWLYALLLHVTRGMHHPGYTSGTLVEGVDRTHSSESLIGRDSHIEGGGSNEITKQSNVSGCEGSPD
jgi:hypothetical protein